MMVSEWLTIMIRNAFLMYVKREQESHFLLKVHVLLVVIDSQCNLKLWNVMGTDFFFQAYKKDIPSLIQEMNDAVEFCLSQQVHFRWRSNQMGNAFHSTFKFNKGQAAISPKTNMPFTVDNTNGNGNGLHLRCSSLWNIIKYFCYVQLLYISYAWTVLIEVVEVFQVKNALDEKRVRQMDGISICFFVVFQFVPICEAETFFYKNF